MEELSLVRFRKALALTIITGLLLLAAHFIVGKNELFLLLNGNLGKVADIVFTFFTILGDGAWWVAVLVLFLVYRRKYWALLVFSFVFSEICIETFKSFLLTQEPRPIKAIANHSLIHTVPNVNLHTIASFPSGHTTQAFVFFLLASLMIDKRWVLGAGFVYAMGIGYSRIYLAQHFPRDVAGGMLFACLSVVLALLVYQQWFNTKKARSETRL